MHLKYLKKKKEVLLRLTSVIRAMSKSSGHIHEKQVWHLVSASVFLQLLRDSRLYRGMSHLARELFTRFTRSVGPTHEYTRILGKKYRLRLFFFILVFIPRRYGRLLVYFPSLSLTALQSTPDDLICSSNNFHPLFVWPFADFPLPLFHRYLFNRVILVISQCVSTCSRSFFRSCPKLVLVFSFLIFIQHRSPT